MSPARAVRRARQLSFPCVSGDEPAVHPIRFASDSRITLPAAVSHLPGGDRFPAQAGTILRKVQPVPSGCTFLVSAAKDALFLTIGAARLPHRACGPALGWSKHLQKMRSEAHCPGLLTVDNFAAKTQIRARITHVGSEYRKDITSGTCALCITDWVARSSPSASSRPSRPVPAPPKWSSASTAPASTTMTGARRSSSTSPGASRVTLTKDIQLSLMPGTSEMVGRFCREKREKRSENTSKNDRPNAPATTPRLLR